MRLITFFHFCYCVKIIDNIFNHKITFLCYFSIVLFYQHVRTNCNCHRCIMSCFTCYSTRISSAHSPATSFFVLRKRKNMRKWSCSSICRLLITDPSGNQFLHVRRTSFYRCLVATLSSSPNYWSVKGIRKLFATTCSDLFFRVIDIVEHFDYSISLHDAIGITQVFLRWFVFIKSLWNIEVTSL